MEAHYRELFYAGKPKTCVFEKDAQAFKTTYKSSRGASKPRMGYAFHSAVAANQMEKLEPQPLQVVVAWGLVITVKRGLPGLPWCNPRRHRPGIAGSWDRSPAVTPLFSTTVSPSLILNRK